MEHTQIEMEKIKYWRTELVRFMMAYKFAVEELSTKISILQEEFQHIHDYNPIEHVKSRVKSPESILKKVQKKKLPLSLPMIQENIRDIAGIRINCSFVTDIYKVANMLTKQQDITLIETKDYIKNPKPNGYKSLHLIVKIPIFMSDRVENVYAEIQIRTIAMDFWASLEHKIYYKYNKAIPKELRDGLKEAAFTANELDEKMERIHNEVSELKEADQLNSHIEESITLPPEFIALLSEHEKHS
ncbi:GTP pyrophosphokinase family protein [Gracilibacillus sp. S3-1-1]|uniref:GTP pyrophosphokinase family protein n=1 Tax=Gracilibacillus pellucidus TaxID=3095368 RepID=A0ACC6M665_9BACI|nr:GTP pyrophosphokinase family protein [Gracilibacillus sp. S3-1-1]MDX8046480.1 GTP pyrophosphokinase family protein [Gracilibacillus sp. S3-1-1]